MITTGSKNESRKNTMKEILFFKKEERDFFILTMLNIPENTELFEHTIATLWFEDSILYSVSKPGARTIDIMKDYISFIKKITDDERVLILSDISEANPMNQETRDYSATHLEEVYKAMAIVSDTPLGDIIGRIFIQLEKQPYPIKIFNTKEAALTWLKELL